MRVCRSCEGLIWILFVLMTFCGQIRMFHMKKSNGGSVFPMKEGQVFIMKNADAVFATSLMRPSQLLCGR